MKNIYLVSSGEYPDYHIEGVFDNLELAKNFAEKFGSSVETWKLNPYKKAIINGYDPYFVRMNKSGDTVEIYKDDSTYGLDQSDLAYDINGNLVRHVFAKDEKHAIKIVNEKRTKLIATNQWGKP